MRRLMLLSLVLLTSVMSWAVVDDVPDFCVTGKDGSVGYFKGSDTEMTFNEEGTVLYLTTAGTNSVVSYAVDGIDAINFAKAGAYVGQYSYDGAHVDVVIDAADDTSYSEMKEQVITDKNHDDYGDFIENYAPTTSVTITYSGDKATVSGAVSGVMSKVSGAHVIISSTKKNIAYTLKGTTANGSFKLYSDYKTQVTLDGVDITNPTGAAINIQSGKTIMVKLVDGSVNKLADGTTYTMSANEDQKGAFFSEGQLVFSGKGSLDVKSIGGHGIVSDDYIRMRNGNITISAVRDGINTNDRFIMSGGMVLVDAQQDGLDVGKGYIEIAAGKLIVNSVDEGVTASYEGDEFGIIDPTITPYIEIKGGLVKVTTAGNKGHGLRAMSTFTMLGGIVQATVRGAGSKALMSEGDMSLKGGKITAFTEGDALYEDGDLSSSAAIRSKGALKMQDVIIGTKSVGAGGKGINNVGDVTLKNSRVMVVTSGATHKEDGLDSRSRGVTTDSNLTLNGGLLLVRSCDEPILVSGNLTFVGGAVYNAFEVHK